MAGGFSPDADLARCVTGSSPKIGPEQLRPTRPDQTGNPQNLAAMQGQVNPLWAASALTGR